ncbi:hypothetical protein BB560_003163, partial [Smittium megazygosporum]
CLEALPAFREFLEIKKIQAQNSYKNTFNKINTEGEIILRLGEVMDEINCSTEKRSAFVPKNILKSMSQKFPWTSGSNQQDAQEFFQALMTVSQKNFALPTSQKGFHSSVISSFKNTDNTPVPIHSIEPQASNPFTGLVASKISCVSCGYSASLNHFLVDCVSIPIPNKNASSLEECLQLYTGIDTLDDFKCRRCQLSATLRQVNTSIDANLVKKNDLSEKIKLTEKNISLCDKSEEDALNQELKKTESKLRSLKKKLEAQKNLISKLENQKKEIEFALSNNIDKDLPGIELSNESTGLSTKQTMFARLPKTLCLHLNRSLFFLSGYTGKNSTNVAIPPVLDMSPFSTSGFLDTRPNFPISKSSLLNDKNNIQNSKYKLVSVIVHIGSHDSGHYYAYKRTKDKNSAKSTWFCVSDSDISRVDEKTVLACGNAFMVFYEKL